MGCYPLFCCAHWDRIHRDLAELERSLVSVVLVSDPFAPVDSEYRAACFPDFYRFYKNHYVVELDKPVKQNVKRRHLEYARHALRQVDVELVSTPHEHLEEWVDLYGQLVKRHDITGLRAFSRTAFEQQLRVPGAVMFRATRNGTALAYHLWYTQDDVAYSHLICSSEQGYTLRAAYALYLTAIEHFRTRLACLDLGGGTSAATDGLVRFKAGWASCTRPVFLCGRILDHDRYQQLATRSRTAPETFFPTYRGSLD
jgi:hypothetical protein